MPLIHHEGMKAVEGMRPATFDDIMDEHTSYYTSAEETSDEEDPVGLAPTSQVSPPAHSTDPQQVECPICGKSYEKRENRPPPIFWQHINSIHISRGTLPPADFVVANYRLVCSTSGCHWLYHQRLRRVGCQRSLGDGKKCGGLLLSPDELPELGFAVLTHKGTPLSDVYPTPMSPRTSRADGVNGPTHPLDLLECALEAAQDGATLPSLQQHEQACIFTLLNSVMCSHTHLHY